MSAPQSIEDDLLQLPEIMIDSIENLDLEGVLSTIINYLWNASLNPFQRAFCVLFIQILNRIFRFFIGKSLTVIRS